MPALKWPRPRNQNKQTIELCRFSFRLLSLQCFSRRRTPRIIGQYSAIQLVVNSRCKAVIRSLKNRCTNTAALSQECEVMFCRYFGVVSDPGWSAVIASGAILHSFSCLNFASSCLYLPLRFCACEVVFLVVVHSPHRPKHSTCITEAASCS